jgi:DNA helicase-2/ATP-dependent DNA helicase PcrA
MSDPFDFTDEPPPPPPARAPAPATPPAYLDGLNESQREAVLATDGPVLMLAGAGTGKTRALTTRLAHILLQGKAHPGEILAVTFTNKAAKEMRERVAALLGRPVEGWWVGTFHALGARILRANAERLGLRSDFTILDADDQLRLVKQLLEARGLDEKKSPARAVLNAIQRWKDRGLEPPRVTPAEDTGEADGQALSLYGEYQERLLAVNACDFGDLLLHCLTLFREVPEVLARYQKTFRYILVDEYQDTNVAQYLWLRALAGLHKNLCCVGDDDQCLAEGSRVTMADGSLRPIEGLRPGDRVLSSHGSGDFRPAEVTDVFRRRRSGETVALTTRSGKRLVSTPEHVHFAGFPDEPAGKRHFVYLMHKRGVGYRLGVTRQYTDAKAKTALGIKVRSNQEHADALWIVGSFDSENEARLYEYVTSLTYRIPTLPFVPRKGGSANGLVHDAGYLERVFRSFDTEANGERLLADLKLDPAIPHHVPQGRNSNRRNLMVTLCGDRRGASPMHRISMVGTDAEGRRILEGLGLSVRPAKRGGVSWRFETCRADYGELMDIADRIRKALDATLVRRARVLSRSLAFTRAGAVVPGMALAGADGTFEVVETVERTVESTMVYDINVAKTHNFVAEGIVTHNSIYSWRGAEVGNILRFEQDYPGATVIRLERNYRSTPHILGAASGLIANNAGRLGKTLWTDLNEGEKVVVRGVWDGPEEARVVGEEVEALQAKGHRLSEMAVLVRAGFQTREFEERLITLGIPYRVVGGLRFYERQEIRDAVAYFRVVAQPDDDLAFERIVNQPKRGLGAATLQTVHKVARAGRMSLVRAVRELVGTEDLKPKPRVTLSALTMDFDRWRALLDSLPHAEVAATILEESGYVAMWKAERSPDAAGRVENLKELVNALEEFPSLQSFLEHVSLVMENDEKGDGDKLSLMTLHGAKGLEFETVFLPGWEEGLFPHQKALDEGGLASLEEERRLAYVGITRARRRAFITFAANRQVYGQWQTALPSRFIDELPPEHVVHRSDRGLYGAERRRRSARFEFDEDPSFLAPAPASPFSTGQRVFHDKFGYGRVLFVDGNKLEVAFDKAGTKKVMDSFVQAV